MFSYHTKLAVQPLVTFIFLAYSREVDFALNFADVSSGRIFMICFWRFVLQSIYSMNIKNPASHKLLIKQIYVTWTRYILLVTKWYLYSWQWNGMADQSAKQQALSLFIAQILERKLIGYYHDWGLDLPVLLIHS